MRPGRLLRCAEKKRLRLLVRRAEKIGLTWAPRGKTPIVVHPFNWKKLSICSVIAYWWNGQKCRLFFRVVGGSYNDEKLISFLEQLLQQPRMGKLILVWDGPPSHRSQRMAEYLQHHGDRLHIVRLPAYAPDINPVLGR